MLWLLTVLGPKEERMKIYTVIKKEFQYNDEIYETLEVDGGMPIKSYIDKDEALLIAHRLSLDALRDLEIGHYCYDISDLGLSSELLEDVFGFKCDGHYFTIPKNSTDEQLETILKSLSYISFYQVIENELVE